MLTLLDGVTAANGIPTLVTHGRPIWKGGDDNMMGGNGFLFSGEGLQRDVDEGLLLIENTAGDNVALELAFARLWGLFCYYKHGEPPTVVKKWAPLGTGTAADKGKINKHDAGGVTAYVIGSVVNGTLVHAERVRGFGECSRLYLELGAFTGANLAIRASLQAYAARPVR